MNDRHDESDGLVASDDAARSGRRPEVRIDVDVAERLLKASSLHAQGALTDAEFVELRERLITPEVDQGADGAS